MSAQHRGRGLVRVLFQLGPGAWGGTVTERLWAEPVGTDRYRLRNTPFFAFGVSAEDVVFAEPVDGQLTFKGVSIRGGHSTYRIVVLNADGFADGWAPLEALGCTFEEGDLLAVDVPQQTDIYEAYRLLELGVDAGVWEFEAELDEAAQHPRCKEPRDIGRSRYTSRRDATTRTAILTGTLSTLPALP
jgi:hypothetical protein